MAPLGITVLALGLGAAAGFKLNVPVPGTGMDPEKITPFVESHVDGFLNVACIKDDMHSHGDKHGDGKAAYKLGEVSNVSIIRYTEMVPKMDQKPMTPEVCFAFCRTVPDMLFFGITNGRDCYCAPYYKQAAGDSSNCDAPCDGDPTKMCGGKTKSTVYSMHACNDAAANLAAAAKKAGKDEASLADLSGKVSSAADYMQTTATRLQKSFGKVGDSAVGAQCQTAKVFAGKCVQAAADGQKHAEVLKAFEGEASSFAGTDQKSEELTGHLQDASKKALELTKDITALNEIVSPHGIDVSDPHASKLYYPVMYFVDKEFEKSPATCGGKTIGEPSVTCFKGCAASCENALLTGCVGYNWFGGGEEKGLCFLFSEMTTATYYTGCDDSVFTQTRPAFLQQGPGGGWIEDGGMCKQSPHCISGICSPEHKCMRPPQAAPAFAGKEVSNCMVKFSSFSGVSLKPDPSGKCKLCLKEAKKANRCAFYD